MAGTSPAMTLKKRDHVALRDTELYLSMNRPEAIRGRRVTGQL
jgi:hypothetical protein